MAKESDDSMYIPSTCNYLGGGDAPWYSFLNKNGGVNWQIYYNSINLFHTYSTVTTNDGGFINAGAQGSTGTIEKLDFLGNALWTRSYSGITMFTSIIQTVDNGYAALGSSGSGTNTGIVLVKLAPDGTVSWAMMYDGLNQDTPGQVRQTNSMIGFDGYIIVGTTNSFSNTNQTYLKFSNLFGRHKGT